MFQSRNNKCQAALAYAMLLVIIVGVMLSMIGYIRRRVQGTYKKAAETFGMEEQHKADTIIK